MKRNYLPPLVGIAMTKSQFCFSTGLSPYKLRQLLLAYPQKWARMGYNRYDKLLMPAMVRELLNITGLRIDMDYYIQYVQGQKGSSSPILSADADS